MPRQRRRLLAGALAFLVLGAAAWKLTRPLIPETRYVIPAHSEDTVLRFLQPLHMGAQIADGYFLDTVNIDGGAIRLGLLNPAQRSRVSIDIVHHTVAPELPEVGGVVLRPGSGTPDAVTQAIRQALDRPSPPASPWVGVLVGHTEPLARVLWREAKVTTVKAWSATKNAAERAGRACRDALVRTAHVVWWALTTPAHYVGATLIALVVALWFLVRALLRTAPPARSVALSLAGLGVLALALRLWLSPRTFLHEYYHTYDNWRYIFQPESDEQYGLTGPVLFRAINRIFGGEERSVFFGNTVFAALTVPVIALFDYSVFGQWSRALLAALLVCVLPEHLRFSGSEELWIVGILLAYGSLAAWAHWLKTRQREALVVAVLSLALAMQTRPELLPLPLAHLGLLLVLKPRSEWRGMLFSRTLLYGLGALILLVSFRLASVVANRKIMPHPTLPSLRTLRLENTLIDWSVTPPLLLFFALAGVVWGWKRYRPVILWLLVFAVAYVLIPLTAFGNRPCIYRTQMFGMTLVAVIAAGAPLLVPKRTWMAVGAVALIAFAGFWTRRTFVTDLFDQQLELAFLEEAVPKLPAKSELIGFFGPRYAIVKIPNPDWLDDFPYFLLSRYGKQAERVSLTDLGVAIQWPDPRPDLVYYQGMDCYVTGAPQQTIDPMRKQCQAVHDHYELQPIDVRKLDTRGYSSAGYAKPPYEVGFYRVTGVRSAARTAISSGR